MAPRFDPVCLCSFPEKSNPEKLEDSAFYFKFRHSSPDVHHEPSEDPDHWYGYCLFRQKRDVSARRNFRQKSLILRECPAPPTHVPARLI